MAAVLCQVCGLEYGGAVELKEVQLRNIRRKFITVSERKPPESFQMRPLQLKISPPQGGWSGETGTSSHKWELE